MHLHPDQRRCRTEVHAVIALVAIPPTNHLPLPVLERALFNCQILAGLFGLSVRQLDGDVGVRAGDIEFVGA